MYMPWVPCMKCATAIKESGITTLISHKEMIMKSHEYWQEDLLRAVKYLNKENINLLMYEGKIDNVKSLFRKEEWMP